MKRLILLLFILVFIPPCESRAQCTEENPCPEVARLNPCIIGGGVAEEPGCVAADNEVGTRTALNPSEDLSAGFSICVLYTPDCYGDLNTGYLDKWNETSSTGRVCVYSDAGTAGQPDASDAKIGCSGEMTSASRAWISSAMDGGTLSSGNYWVCTFIDDNTTSDWSCLQANTGGHTVYYKDTNLYDSPPSALGTGWSSSGWQDMSVYVSVGE
jgi:hypothetical protein